MNLVLKKIEIAGVRSIGWSADGGPGLVLDGLGGVNIIAAPNGVGKTSIIEALTLALTGESRRNGGPVPLDAIKHSPQIDHLRASVSLQYSGANELRWEEPDDATKGESTQRVQTNAAMLLSLKQSESEVVANLLRLTHLLPQGWGERFGDQSGSARWSLVERALDLNGVRAAVRAGQGKGALRVSLEKLKDDAAAATRAANDAVSRWVACRENWIRAKEGGAAAGAKSPSELRPTLDAIAAELGVRTGNTPLSKLRDLLEERRVALRNSVGAVDALLQRRLDAEAQFAGAQAELAASEGAHREAESAVQIARSVLGHSTAAASRAALPRLKFDADRAAAIERACSIRLHIAALREAGAKLRAAEERLSGAEEAHQLDDAVVTAERDMVAAQAALEAANRTLAGAERDQSEFARLLRDLRPHVAKDGRELDECPICSTEFPARVLLDRLDERLASLSDAASAELRQKVAAAELKLAAATEQVRDAKARREAIDEARRVRAEVLRSIEGIRSGYPSVSASEPADISTLVEHLHARVRELVSDETQLADVPLNAARQARETAARALLAAEETIRASGPSSAPLEDLPTIEVARLRVEAAETKLGEAVHTRAAVAKRLDVARRTVSALAAEWERVGFAELADTPLDQVASRMESIRQARTQALDLVDARLGEVARSAEAFTRLEALRLAEAALRTEAESHGESLPPEISDAWLSEVDDRLRQNTVTLKAASERLQKRVDTVGGWISRLSTGLQEYERDCLERMEPFVTRYRDALAPTMRWRTTLTKHRNEAITEFANEDAPDVEPAQLLSEGEQTAVSLSYLLAFHTRYQWSRWPALVLDDPFQAADVVRSGALLDVLQGLNLACGTQILLTTHDAQLADWAGRKMKSAGVDVRRFDLERTADGIRARDS